MKLIFAIVMSDVADTISRALVTQHYTVTQISSMGGFLRRGSVTFVVGVEEAQVAQALATLRGAVPTPTRADGPHAVTLFVIDSEQFIQI